jgi:hypothetical protein
MKTLSRSLAVALLALFMMSLPMDAATPKDGRYKGTMTVRVVVDGNTKAEAKKVIPMAGVLTGGTMVVVMTEAPPISTKFQGPLFHAAVGDGTVQIKGYPGNYFNLANPKTTTTAIKGSTDFGAFPATGGTGYGRYSIDVTLTRVGN